MQTSEGNLLKSFFRKWRLLTDSTSRHLRPVPRRKIVQIFQINIIVPSRKKISTRSLNSIWAKNLKKLTMVWLWPKTTITVRIPQILILFFQKRWWNRWLKHPCWKNNRWTWISIQIRSIQTTVLWTLNFTAKKQNLNSLKESIIRFHTEQDSNSTLSST